MSAARLHDHAVVAIAALDVRRKPDHASELLSQLLMGETVRVLRRAAGGQWWRVESLVDGYRGWIRAWGVREASAARVTRWRRLARARVTALYAEVRERPGGGALLSPVFWNARLIPARRRGRWRELELPDGRKGWVAERAVQVGRLRPPSLTQRLRDLLGVPYLWGGRTPLGFDCSGLTQQVLAERGFALPRDADQQRGAVHRLDRSTVRQGDLVFFGRLHQRLSHVGIALGGGYYLHSRGTVRVNSLEPNNPLYDSALAAMFRGYGRPGRRSRARRLDP